MKHLIHILLFNLIAITSYSQIKSIKKLAENDTLTIKIEKIACRYGLDSRLSFRITKTKESIKINSGNGDYWTILTDDQFKFLIGFEKKGMRKGCNSTSYATVQVLNSNEVKDFTTCWDDVDELNRIIKLE